MPAQYFTNPLDQGLDARGHCGLLNPAQQGYVTHVQVQGQHGRVGFVEPAQRGRELQVVGFEEVRFQDDEE